MDRDKSKGYQSEEKFQHPDPIKDVALDWFLRLNGAPEDAELKAQLETWLAQDSRHAAEFSKLRQFWGLPELDVATRRVTGRIDGQTKVGGRPTRTSRRASPWRTSIAAAAAVVVIALGAWQYPTLILRWKADYLTAAGEQNTVTLPDGSRMILNTATAVALDFDNGRRAIALLEGEAFFDVVQDSQHPFTVTASFGEVEVKGTAFSVRTDHSEDTVVLERGRVDVSRLADKRDHAILSPSETVSVSGNAISAVQRTDTTKMLAWREGWIVFHEKPFALVLDDLRRYYGGLVVTLDDRMGRVPVSGRYRLANPEGVIRSLAEAAGADVTSLPGGTLILR